MPSRERPHVFDIVIGGNLFGFCMRLQPILIAEDDDNDAIILGKLLQKSYVKNPLVFVSDGEDAVAYLKREPPFTDPELFPTPVLMMLDLKMPRMDGLEFLEWLRTQPPPSFPIVILTGCHDLNVLKQAYQMGAHSFFIKPVDRKELAAFVGKFKGVEFGDPIQTLPVSLAQSENEFTRVNKVILTDKP